MKSELCNRGGVLGLLTRVDEIDLSVSWGISLRFPPASARHGFFLPSYEAYGSDAVIKDSPLMQCCLAVGLSHVFANRKSRGTRGKRFVGKLSWCAIRRTLKGLLAILVIRGLGTHGETSELIWIAGTFEDCLTSRESMLGNLR